MQLVYCCASHVQWFIVLESVLLILSVKAG